MPARPTLFAPLALGPITIAVSFVESRTTVRGGKTPISVTNSRTVSPVRTS